MKSPPKKRKGEPPTDIDALYPVDPAIDDHNIKVTTMIELLKRNVELRERVEELEKELEELRTELLLFRR